MKEEGTRMATQAFNVRVTVDEDGWFTAKCLDLQGCHAQGKTKAEALASVRQVIEGQLESMRKHGEPLPARYHASQHVIRVAVPA